MLELGWELLELSRKILCGELKKQINCTELHSFNSTPSMGTMVTNMLVDLWLPPLLYIVSIIWGKLERTNWWWERHAVQAPLYSFKGFQAAPSDRCQHKNCTHLAISHRTAVIISEPTLSPAPWGGKRSTCGKSQFDCFPFCFFNHCQRVRYLIGRKECCRHAHKLAQEGNLIIEESGYPLRNIDGCVLGASPLCETYWNGRLERRHNGCLEQE